METPTLNNSAVPLYDLLYVGHSMGTTMSFVMLSLRPEYNEKIQAAFALAPVAYMSKVKSPIRLLAPFSKDIQVQLNIYICTAIKYPFLLCYLCALLHIVLLFYFKDL